MIEALDIHVKGIVQGVGFRPFVYRMAKKYLVNGWVLNAADGVSIHAEGEGKLLDQFVLELSENAPAAAQVKEIDLAEVPLQDCSTFEIRFSDERAVEETTLVSADLATCDDCLRELFDPADRRYRYPFINCTNCGPRFTIASSLPYDRARTSMRGFTLCDACAAEYADPGNRRFHAQPNACFECGPHVSLSERDGDAGTWRTIWGNTREESDGIFARAVSILMDGGIVAVKGLGGFHLVCDAKNPRALADLRARKHRDNKAFAVMVAAADDVRGVCEVGPEEEKLLASPQRPIVLLRKRPGAKLAPGLADGLCELGVMLPCTPVQHLLIHDFAAARAHAGAADSAMLVMTSGNLHDEPIVTDDAEAAGKLGDIADAIVGNDRAILSRYDDSVVRVIKAASAGAAVQVIRRARGFAPVPLKAPVAFRAQDALASAGDAGNAATQGALATCEDVATRETVATRDTAATCEDVATREDVPTRAAAPALLAVGPEQKTTLTFVRGTDAFVSQHVGDLENAETFDAWLQAASRLETLFEVRPAVLACDSHPEYLSSKWAHEQARSRNLPLVQTQHHHAHIASVLGEHAIDGAVCGIAFDGTGFGADGAIWGGEVLIANQQAFERFANFAYVPMPGGAAAVKNPLRMAYGALWEFDLLDHPAARGALDALGDQARICDQMIEKGLNTPMTSSVGRLFDAASALLGICEQPTYEGEAAVALEAAAWQAATRDGLAAPGAIDPRYSVAITKNTATAQSTAQDTSVVLFDPAPTFKALLDDAAAGVGAPDIAFRFHGAIVEAIVNAAKLAYNVYGITTVALSGGVFMNRLVIEGALALLEAEGFTAAINRDLPPNDGCISFGQAVIACAQGKKDEKD